MPITYTHSETKNRIIEFINSIGPSLPVQIARKISISPLFASAFLSELHEEGRLKISNLRVGSSPLYYIAGQEDDLEKFTQYLNQKEREAFNLIKNKKILEDESQQPAIRVALRSIKDFAVPFKIDGKIFWKHFALTDQEAKTFLNPKPEEKPETIEKPEKEKKQIEKEVKIIAKEKPEKEKKQIEKEVKIIAKEKPKRKKKSVKLEESQFQKYVKEYLKIKDIEVLELIADKKKEVNARIRIDTLFGKQEYYLIAKDKKRLTENDINTALQRSNSYKMPAVLMSSADFDKKANEYIKSWKNLIKNEKISF